MKLLDKIRRNREDLQWREVEEYRDLLQTPDHFEEGFTMKTVIGVLFISLIMTPGEMYLGLFNGGGIGSAAQWVTVILFLEVAKRSFTTLRRQEIYLLVYVASALVAREEGAFLDLLWRQYFVRSPEAEAFGLTRLLPWWWAPPADSEALVERTFLHPDWAAPILLLVLGTIIGRISWFTSGYLLFRLTSDKEQLPFPTAPMSALSAMALAEESGGEEESWKWPVFSIGTVIGAAFGVIYTGIPTVTDVMFGKMVKLIPIPFWDLTPYFGSILPATPVAIAINLGGIFAGLFAPFWGIIGSVAGTIIHYIISPILYAKGYFPRWQLGSDAIQTGIVTGIDFWQPFSIGITLAVTIISIYMLWATGSKSRVELRERLKGAQVQHSPICQHQDCQKPSEVRGLCLKHLARGDFNIWGCVALFCVAAIYPIILAKTLFPQIVGTGLIVTFFIIAFLYAPLISFVSARLDGLIGRNFSLPYINEAIIYLSGFRGVEIWFVPFPVRNYGGHAEGFRVVELTGMRFTSLLKAEVFMLPIIFGVSLMYWSFLWKLAPIPSESYPYAQLMWPRQAFYQAMGYSATTYNVMWRAGEQVESLIGVPLEDEEPVGRGECVWSPSNLQDKQWWYWRARAARGDQVTIPDPLKRQYGPWSESGYFYTDFSGENPPTEKGPETLEQFRIEREAPSGADLAPAPVIVWPPLGTVVDNPNPNMRTKVEVAAGDTVEFYYEVDMLPTFDGEFLQHSADIPIFWKAVYLDHDYTGNRRDDDGDMWVETKVIGVDPDGLGARAGMLEGDRLHAVGGVPIRLPEWSDENLNQTLGELLSSAKDSLFIEFERAGKRVAKRVERLRGQGMEGQFTLDGSFWGMGETKILTQSMATAGLGDRVGLKEGDQLLAINGVELHQIEWDEERLEQEIDALVHSTRDSLALVFEREEDILYRQVAFARGEDVGMAFRAGKVQGIDEELINGEDDDGDGRIDEDFYHPLDDGDGGEKWKVIVFGAAFGLTGYTVLNFFGMPLFLIFGYVSSVNDVSFGWMFTLFGALLARFYFWKRYGQQQWRQYAMVLAVGYGVGMALIGMFCAALAMIAKSVSSLQF